MMSPRWRFSGEKSPVGIATGAGSFGASSLGFFLRMRTASSYDISGSFLEAMGGRKTAGVHLLARGNNLGCCFLWEAALYPRGTLGAARCYEYPPTHPHPCPKKRPSYQYVRPAYRRHRPSPCPTKKEFKAAHRARASAACRSFIHSFIQLAEGGTTCAWRCVDRENSRAALSRALQPFAV